ncbi:GIY-YIG nuclease family protein [Bacilliculturomica massiliensis]|uniref:GIY-YIG nuclease family protein n=1 Tax=Bacilliculturomica massiliensis TaxID=1917867 RepID=UPI001031FDEA|nr:GIY-YIG nuclease family protein [Bacilliculturomica massiliensis]
MDKEQRRQAAAEYKMKQVTGGVYIVRNRETGSFFLKGDSNLEGSRNRFEFAKKTSCMYLQLKREWEQYGPEAFEFAVLEETKQKETESPGAFRDRLKKMEELWREKLSQSGEDGDSDQ